MVCLRGESLTHHIKQMKPFHALIAGAVLSTSIVTHAPARSSEFFDNFFNDQWMKKDMVKLTGVKEELINSEAINEYRAGFCEGSTNTSLLPAKIKHYCGSLNLRKSPTMGTNAKSDPAVTHDQCLEARDYEGCVKVKSGNGSIIEEKCGPKGWCVSAGGRDVNNQKKPVGWVYKEADDGVVTYVDPGSAQRVPHKGQSDRYITYVYKISYYQPPTAPRTSTYGTANTFCNSYGGYGISCTTSPATTVTTPGRVGGYKMITGRRVVDCKDKTSAGYSGGKVKGKWTSITNNRFCSEANKLPVSTIKL